MILTTSGKSQNAYTSLYDKKFKVKLEEYETNVKTFMKIDKSPGIAIAFVKGNFVWSKGFGSIDLENETEINSESLFNNKTLLRFSIVSAILQLYEEGKINLDSSLVEIKTKSKPFTLHEILKKINTTIFIKFNQKTGFKYPYQSSISFDKLDNYILTLISIIEKASGQKIDVYLKEHIWNPLLMFSTRLENKRAIIKNRAKSYSMHKGQLNNFIIPNNNNIDFLKVRTTVNDMIKFTYGFYSNKLFPKHQYTSFFSIDNHAQESKLDWINWTYQPVNGRFGFGFLNDFDDDNTILVSFPQDTFVIAIASNLKNADLFPYLTRLYQLIFDEPYFLTEYTDNKKNNIKLKLMDIVFNDGLATYKTNENIKINAESNIEFFNSLLNEIDQNGKFSLARLTKIEKLKLSDLGKFIASELTNQNDKISLDKYHSRGSIEFLNDFVVMYKNQENWSEYLRFTKSFEDNIEKWNQEWKETLNNFTSSFYLDPAKNQQEDLEKLKGQYKKYNIVPDLCSEFSIAIDQFSKLNKIEEAQGVGAIAIELFDKCPEVYHALGISFAWFNDADITYDLFKKAQEFTSPSYSRVEHFIKIADHFKTWGKIKEAISMIDRATKLDKKQPRLYSKIGDLNLEINQRTRAKRYYTKALKIDPEFEYAKIKINTLKDVN